MRSLFGTRIEPSRICLGTGSFGSEISKNDSFAVFDAFVEAGGNFLDTAHIYAAWIQDGWGASERTVGEWLRVHGARDQVILATKGGHPPLDNMALGRCSRACIEQDLNESLDRLGVESVDLYWLHRDDPDLSPGEIIETLASIAREGRIACYGASNWVASRIEAANAYAAEHGLPPFVSSQPGWALADHETDKTSPSPMLYLDESMRQWHVRTGFPLVAYSSQAGGFFSVDNVAWARTGCVGPIPKRKACDTPANRRRLLKAIELADDKGVTANQIALAYLLSQPFPVFAIIGTGRPDHAREALAASALRLSEAQCASLRDA